MLGSLSGLKVFEVYCLGGLYGYADLNKVLAFAIPRIRRWSVCCLNCCNMCSLPTAVEKCCSNSVVRVNHCSASYFCFEPSGLILPVVKCLGFCS